MLNDAWIGNCFDDEWAGGGRSYGTFDQAKGKCSLEPTCTALHDWSDDNQNWRACSDGIFAENGDQKAATFHVTGGNRILFNEGSQRKWSRRR